MRITMTITERSQQPAARSLGLMEKAEGSVSLGWAWALPSPITEILGPAPLLELTSGEVWFAREWFSPVHRRRN